MREVEKTFNTGYGVKQFELISHEWLKDGIEFLVNIELENGVDLKDVTITVDRFDLDKWEIDIEADDEYTVLRIALGLNKGE